jgi:dTDP-4-amino-4,6-dideoxygalactose transaminase
MIGGNFRLDALQAALLRVKLPLLAAYTEQRRRHAAEYQRLLAGLRDVVLPVTHPDRTHIVNQYTIRVRSNREAFRSHLERRGIASAIYYPVPLHLQECFREFAPVSSLPVCEALAAEVLSLPVFQEMTAEEQATVAAAATGYSS